MTFCFNHNINCLYLPAHTSHGLQALDNAVFACLKRAYEAQIDQLNSLTDGSPVGKMNLVKCLKIAREAVSKKTIQKGFAHTGTWPISRAKALQHPEINNFLPENQQIGSGSDAEESEDEREPVTRDRIMALAKDTTSNTRDKRQEAREIADEFDNLRGNLAISERENAALRAQIAELTKTKKKRAIPNPTGRFMSGAEIAAKKYTVEALEAEETAPKRRKTAAKEVVVVESESESDAQSEATSEGGYAAEEYVIPAEIRTRSGRTVKQNPRYKD